MKQETLEDALRHLEPARPSDSVLANCLATIPESLPERSRPSHPLLRFWQNKTGQRLAFATLALIGIAVWTTFPGTRPDGAEKAPASAFAETAAAMKRVTHWRSTSRQIVFDPGDGKKTHFRYYFNRGWVETEEWFDQKRGCYTNHKVKDGETIQRELMLPNGDWYYRHGDPPMGWDKVRITHMGQPYWQKMLAIYRAVALDPASSANNFDRAATEPPTKKWSVWKGRRMLVFTFAVAPSEYYKAGDPPVQRTELYVDPETKLIHAYQKFVSWKNHPDRGEHLTVVVEFDYTPFSAEATEHFDPKRFCEGTKEIQEQNYKPGSVVTLDPE